MSKMSCGQTSIVVATALSLAACAFPVLSNAASTSMPQGIQSSAPGQNESEYQLAQASANCRRVGTNGTALNVRSSAGGTVIGSLPDTTLVTIRNTGTNGWVPISSPRQGYVSGAYLKSCTQPVPPSQTPTPGDNCRIVSGTTGLRVRQTASLNAPILGGLTNQQRVTIVNRGTNGWVPISSPVNGYVSGAYLKYCP
ncbi:MAG: SH3 domain-containing protein [Aphanothece sp. CMT-3BRIN-NPC111]|jgi:hypothetical protein|nr:SH3 domain-containing protein [Aphanothece sp. CMT-3BRIN-NPC111]